MTTTATGYAAAHDAAIVVDRPGRTLLRLHGRDPVRMVQGLISNDIEVAAAGRAVYAAVLTPKGRMVAGVRVFRRPANGGGGGGGGGTAEDVWLDADGEAGAGLVEHLKRSVPPLFARVDDRSAASGLLGVFGPSASDALRSVEVEVPPEAEGAYTARAAEAGELLAVRTHYAGVDGFDLIGPADALDALRPRLVEAGAVPAGAETLEVLRIEAGSPRWGAELDTSTIPLEAGLRERAISETKGCYTGQEVIVRILHRGHVNRHLRGLLLGDVAPPPAGTELVRPDDAKVVGTITSACVSPKFGQTIALGYVRREVEPPAEVEVAEGAGTARVVALPFGGSEG